MVNVVGAVAFVVGGVFGYVACKVDFYGKMKQAVKDLMAKFKK